MYSFSFRQSAGCKGTATGAPSARFSLISQRRHRCSGSRTTASGKNINRKLMLRLPFVCALVCLLLSSTTTVFAAEPIYLLNAMHSDKPYQTDDAKAMWDGMNAAFYASSYTVGNNRPLTIVEPDPSVDVSDIAAVVTKAVADYPTLFGVLGPYSDLNLAYAVRSDAAKTNNLMMLAPFTGSSSVRKWNKQMYFTRAEPLVELKVIVQYILKVLRARRIGYMFLRNAYYGQVEYTAMKTILSNFAWDAPTLYAVDYSSTDTAVNMTAFDILAESNPQVVVVWGYPGQQTYEFARKLMTDSRTSSAVIMSCFGLQGVLHDAYMTVHAETGFTMTANQIISSATSRSPTDDNTNVTHMSLFYTEMSDFIANSGKSAFSLTDGLSDTEKAAAASMTTVEAAKLFFQHNSIAGQLMVVGWIGGKIIQRTLERVDWLTDRNTYQAGLFDQNRWIIGGDAVYGDYGGECDGIAAETGAMCNCNQGGHSAFLTGFNTDTVWSMMDDTMFTYSQSSCYSTDVSLPKPLSVLTVAMSDSEMLTESANRLSAILPAAFDFLNTTAVSLSMRKITASSATEQSVIDTEMTNYMIDVLVGPVTDELDFGSIMVTMPAFTHRRTNIDVRTFITMMPIFRQEVYILYASLPTIAAATGAEAKVHVIYHGYSAKEEENMSYFFTHSADTFGYPDPSFTSVDLAADSTSAFSATGINFIVGLTDTDAAAIANFLNANPSASVIIDYKDFALSYDAFWRLFSAMDTSVRRRFLSFTNMPLWSDTSDEAHAASQLLSLFHQMVPDTASHTPANLEDMVCAVFLRSLATQTDIVNSTNMVDTLYLKGTLSAYDMQFGKYQWSCSTTATGETCTYKNYGAQSIVVFSMERVLDPTVPVTVDATTPSMVYITTRHKKSLTTGQLIGIIVGSVAGGLLLIGGFLAILFCCVLKGRDNEAAPKLAQEPVTLIFTDIESSTALWAALPQLMPDAVATHHRVIRAAIEKHKGYEVKTIGDSFMIACKDATLAVKLAVEIQTKLMDADWKSDEIDETYRRFEEQRALDNPSEQPHSAQLDAETYKTQWHGFRVRMGIHTGLSDIRLDEVTKGYDYYGDTSNMAARTEAIANGGQVILTETTWWALSDAVRESLDYTKMGPQGLRGVPYAVDMYQLNPVPGRKYMPLRTEIEAILPDDAATSYTGDNTTDDPNSSRGALSSTAAAVAFVLASCYSTYPPAQRIRELQPLLSKWSVPAPPRTSGVSDEDYCQGLFNRLAVRVGRVTEARLRQNVHEGSNGTADPNLFNSIGALAGLQRNPLFRGTNSTLQQQQDYWEDAPQPFREHNGMGNLREFFRSIVSPQSSVRSQSVKGNRRSSAFHQQDEMKVYDISASRVGGPDSRHGTLEAMPGNVNVPGRLTNRRNRRTSCKSDAVTGNNPLEE